MYLSFGEIVEASQATYRQDHPNVPASPATPYVPQRLLQRQHDRRPRPSSEAKLSLSDIEGQPIRRVRKKNNLLDVFYDDEAEAVLREPVFLKEAFEVLTL